MQTQAEAAARLGSNPRYANYARAHGRTPEEQHAQDRLDWSGGYMAGFILWNSDRLLEFSQVNPDAFCFGSLIDGEAYDAWLTQYVDNLKVTS